jgi:hypothetical protein
MRGKITGKTSRCGNEEFCEKYLGGSKPPRYLNLQE